MRTKFGAGAVGGRLHGRGDFFRACFDLGPAPPERGHDDRLDDEQDVFAAGVVRAQLSALFLIEDALEEGAEDGRLHAAPVQLRGVAQNAHILVRKIEHRIVAGAKEAAVEMVNGGKTEFAVASGHGGEELLELADEFLGLLAVDLNRFSEEIIGKQADAVGKEAKQQLHDKAGDGLVVGVAVP